MTCAFVRSRLSDWLDGGLEPAAARQVQAHLASCASCARREEELRAVGRLLSELPRLEPSEPVAARVRDRIELETRPPALAFLFRGFSAARPYMLPSLAPALLVVVTVLAAALALDPGPLPEVHLAPGYSWATPPSGTEKNPLFPSEGIDVPRELTAMALAPEILAGQGEGTMFLETIVARDGTVADVTVLEGDYTGAVQLVDALRRQTFEPVRYRGRPVAVSVYRLISRMEVRVPRT